MDDLAELRQLYFQECEELLGEVERHLMALDEGSGDAQTVNATFRALHSIKGGAGAFGLQRLVDYAHVFEALLDKMRSNEIPVTPDRVKVLLRAGDVLTDLIRSLQSGTELPQDREADMKAALETLAQGGAVTLDAAAPAAPAPAPKPTAEAPKAVPVAAAPPAAAPAEPVPVSRRYRIVFAPRADMFKRANEPLLLIRELGGLGMTTVEIDQSAVPALDDIDPEAAYLRWTIELETPAAIDVVRDVFEFASDDCDLEIVDLSPPEPAAPEEPAQEAPAEAVEQPVEIAAEPPVETAAAPVAEEAAAAAEAATPTAAKNVQVPAKDGAAAATPQVSSIRVDLDKLEKVVNLVGEIVISQAMLTEHLGALSTEKFGGLIKGIEELSQHTRSLQDSVMAMRAQPVKSVFQRMPRLVREVAAATGKKVRLVLHGEETEIDKTVIEQLYDPLVHMMRNSVDHGVEPPEERVATGKPAEGTVRLSAGHAGGRILIEISDDGKGINRERVFQKAVSKGLIPADLSLTESQIDDLIFLPGLSTADQVSNISGRGVGMDVVRSNIQRMGGRVSIKSTPGQGSVFTLALPLTLAVLDGMNVRVGDEIYVVPLANIIESLRPTTKDVHSLAGGGDVLLIRGEYVPLVYVG
ncbi:MAG TPA: chemotaxis protein CheA, partial [Candidatus Angelobacter sp.]|nr:chemotaxis protein CheA [Candidatus Angelobacter sp.]